MFIVWGSAGDVIKLGKSERKHVCPACGNDDFLDLSLVYKYGHVYFIFAYVSKKDYVASCSACQVIVDVDLPEMVFFKDSSRIPFMRRFGCLVGIVLLAILVGFIIVDESSRDRSRAGSAQAPLGRSGKKVIKKLEKILKDIDKTITDESFPQSSEEYKDKNQYAQFIKALRNAYTKERKIIDRHIQELSVLDYSLVNGNVAKNIQNMLIPALQKIVEADQAFFDCYAVVDDDKKMDEIYDCIKEIQAINKLINDNKATEQDKERHDKVVAQWEKLISFDKISSAGENYENAIKNIEMFYKHTRYYDVE